MMHTFAGTYLYVCACQVCVMMMLAFLLSIKHWAFRHRTLLPSPSSTLSLSSSHLLHLHARCCLSVTPRTVASCTTCRSVSMARCGSGLTRPTTCVSTQPSTTTPPTSHSLTTHSSGSLPSTDLSLTRRSTSSYEGEVSSMTKCLRIWRWVLFVTKRSVIWRWVSLWQSAYWRKAWFWLWRSALCPLLTDMKVRFYLWQSAFWYEDEFVCDKAISDTKVSLSVTKHLLIQKCGFVGDKVCTDTKMWFCLWQSAHWHEGEFVRDETLTDTKVCMSVTKTTTTTTKHSQIHWLVQRSVVCNKALYMSWCEVEFWLTRHSTSWCGGVLFLTKSSTSWYGVQPFLTKWSTRW